MIYILKYNFVNQLVFWSIDMLMSYIMMVVARSKLNPFEVFSMYTGFSIYAGWVTTATILNATYCFKGMGFSEERMDISESKVTCYVLWIA